MSRIIKISATTSTNDHLRALNQQGFVRDGDTVLTYNQTAGKGQQGALWHYEQGKSLAFSVFRNFEAVSWDHQFFVNFSVCLAIKNAFVALDIPKVFIKWPNDILADSKKVCGVLVENKIQPNGNYNSIIGVGVNVNNEQFLALPKASSLKLQTGVHYNLDEVFHSIRNAMEATMIQLRAGNLKSLKAAYEEVLFKKDTPAAFKTSNGTIFSGMIVGASNAGTLQIALEDGSLKDFQQKEIQLLY